VLGGFAEIEVFQCPDACGDGGCDEILWSWHGDAEACEESAVLLSLDFVGGNFPVNIYTVQAQMVNKLSGGGNQVLEAGLICRNFGEVSAVDSSANG
jgi:hypothetical protein